MSAEDHESHGNSLAAWASVAVMLAGFLVGSIAVLEASTPMFVVGAVLIAVGALMWPILTRMGYGDKNPPRSLYS
ncbi:MAG: HGxxPAAW family protein [Dermatophilaceae bacterium]